MADQTIPSIKNLRGNIGIGLISPSTKLHVKGNVRAEASGSTAFADLKSSQIYASSTYDLIVGSNNPLFFRTNDQRRMTILGGGNVGIGTTSPSAKLDISSDDEIVAIFSSTDNKGIIQLSDDDTNIYLSAENSRASLGFYQGAHVNNLNFYNNNLGIGTATPAEKLHVDSGNIQLTNGNYIIFDGPTPKTTKMRSYYDGSQAHIAMTVANTAVLDLRADGLSTFSGDVVIGGGLTINGTTTTINSTTLQVDDKNIELGTVATPSDTTADGGGITLKGASDYTIQWTNSTNSWHFNQGITVGEDGTGHDVVFYGDTADRYMTWDQSADTLNFRDNVKATFGNDEDLQIFHNGSNSYIRDNGTGGLVLEGSTLLELKSRGGEVYFRGTENGAVNLYHDNGNRLSTISTGVYIPDSLGVGAATPSKKLHVSNGQSGFSGTYNARTQAIIESDNSSGTALAIMSKNTGNSALWFGDQDGETVGQVYYNHPSNYLALSASGATRAVLNGTGLALGLNHTDPTVNLDIEGASNVIVDLVTTTANANTTIRFRDGSSTETNKATIGYDGTNDGLILTTGSFTAGNGIFIDDNQNVGIGTSSPNVDLDLRGDMRLDSSGSTDRSIYFRNQSSLAQIKSDKGLQFQVAVSNAPAAAMTITENYRNVGIGTTNPTNKLHVAGDLKIETVSTSSSNRVLVWDSLSEVRYKDISTADQTYNGDITFNGTTSESDNNGTRFSNTNYVQFEGQPMSRLYGNECLWVDRHGSVSTSGTIIGANNVFRTGDNYCQFSSTTGTNNPIVYTIDKTFSATTAVNNRRICIFAHIGFTCDLKIEVKNSSGTYETVFDASHTFSSGRWSFFRHDPEISYPTDWSIQGLRFTFDNYGTTTRYIGQIGITNIRNHNTFPYIARGGGNLYDDSVLSFGNNGDLEIYHDGSNSYITDGGTGNLLIKGASVEIQTVAGNKYFTGSSNVAKLYHTNNEKLATTSTGVSVTGRLTASEVAVTNIVTNKVVKFNGTLLDDSIITDNGSTVTVGGALTATGTITGSQFIQSGSTGSEFYAAKFGRSNLSESNPDMYGEGDTLILGADYDQPTLVIRDTEKVGIGTANPPQKLSVKGTFVHLNDSDVQVVGITNASGHGRIYAKGSDGVTDVLLDAGGVSYLNGGNVGIGTTTPSRTLHVYDSAGPTIKFERGTASNLEFTFGSTNASIVSAGEIQFRANGGTTNKFIINNSQIQSNAKFLVNTNSGIDVHTNDSGNILLSGNSSATGTPDQFFLKHNLGGVELGNNRGNTTVTTGNFQINTQFRLTGSGSGLTVIRHNGTNNYYENYNGHTFFTNHDADKSIYFQTDDGSGGVAEYFRMDGVDLKNVFSKGLRVPDGSVSDPAIAFTSETNTGIYATSSQLNFAVDGSTRMYLTSAGIFSNGNVYSATTGQFRNYGGTWQATTGTGTNGFTFKNTNEAQTAATITSKGTLTLNGGTTSTKIYLYETYTDASNYERTTFEYNSGYLNIDATSSGTGTTSGIKLGANGYTFLQLEPEGNVLINGANDNSNRADFAVGVGGSPRVSWQGNQVQIGGTDMNYNGNISYSGGVFRMQTWTSNLSFECKGGSGSGTRDIIFRPFNDTADTEAMRIKGDGKVGIGTTSPDTLLEVAGVIKSSSTSRVQADVYNNSANSANIIYRTDRTIVGNNASALVILDGGNVGTGTTNPSEKLHVVGSKVRLDTNAGGYYGHNASGTFRYALYDNNSVTRLYGDGNGSNAALEIDSNKVGLGCAATANSKASVFIKGEDNSPTLNGTAVDDATLILTNSYTTDPYGLCFGVNTSGTSLVQSRRLGSETYFKLALNPYGGNVGIGTDSPNQELEVDGVIKQKVYTVSTLPTAGSSTIGARAFVSDSYYAFSSSYLGSQISGGGSNFSPVYSDGSYWYMG